MHNVNISYTLDHEKATKRNGPSPGKDDGHIGGQLIDISQAMLTSDNLSVAITPLMEKGPTTVMSVPLTFLIISLVCTPQG